MDTPTKSRSSGLGPLREVWFTHLLLLGFDPLAAEAKFKTAFTSGMFSLINKKGMEVVMHFLFSQLDSHLAYEEFRDCWPVCDKKQEQQFRRACANWLAKIAKEEPESKLPRLAASLLLSPGGDKFCIFMRGFSSYVLRMVCIRDAKAVERQVVVPSYLTTSAGLPPAHRGVALAAVKAHVCRHTERAVKQLQLTEAMHEEWRGFAAELVTKFRAANKEGRMLAKRLSALQDQQKERAVGSTPKRGALSVSEERALSLSVEVSAARLQDQVEEVRSSWKAVEQFDTKTYRQREVVNSILQGRANQCCINAKDVDFQVPEMLIQEYEEMMRQGKIGNTYEAGKLNLTSLVQVWSCALKVLQDKIHSNEVPSFEAETCSMLDFLQSHRGHLASAQTLRVSLEELRLSLDKSISELETRLQPMRDSAPSQRDGQPEEEGGSFAPALYHIPAITIPSLGFDLLPPSPKKPGHAPSQAASPDSRPSLPTVSQLGALEETVSTPDAVQNISRSIQLASQRAAHSKPPSSQIPSLHSQRSRTIPASTPATSRLTSHLHKLSIFDDSPEGISRGALLRDPPPNIAGGALLRDPPPTIARGSHLKDPPLNISRGAPLGNPPPNVHSSNSAAPTSRHRDQTPLTATEQRTTKARSGRTEGKRPRRVARPGKGLATTLNRGSGKLTFASPARVGRGQPQSSPASTLVSPPHPLPGPTPAPVDSHALRAVLGVPQAYDLLADQIAAAVAECDTESASPHTPGTEIHSLLDPVSAMGNDAFVTKDKLARTPSSMPRQHTTGIATIPSHSSPLLQSPAHTDMQHSPLNVTTKAPDSARKEPDSPELFPAHHSPSPVTVAPVTPSVGTEFSRLTQPPSYSLTPSPTVLGGTSKLQPASPLLSVSFPSPDHSPSSATDQNTSSQLSISGSPAALLHGAPASAASTPLTSADRPAVATPLAPDLSTPLARGPRHVSALSSTVSPLLAVVDRSSLATPPVSICHDSSTPLAPKVSPALPPPSTRQTPLQTGSTPLVPAEQRKVSFGQTFTPQLVSPQAKESVATPLLSPGFLTSVLPPTPFQHANFDLDSSDDLSLLHQSEDSPKVQATTDTSVHVFAHIEHRDKNDSLGMWPSGGQRLPPPQGHPLLVSHAHDELLDYLSHQSSSGIVGGTEEHSVSNEEKGEVEEEEHSVSNEEKGEEEEEEVGKEEEEVGEEEEEQEEEEGAEEEEEEEEEEEKRSSNLFRSQGPSSLGMWLTGSFGHQENGGDLLFLESPPNLSSNEGSLEQISCES